MAKTDTELLMGLLEESERLIGTEETAFSGICVSVRGGMWISAFMPIVFCGGWCVRLGADYQTTRALRIARSLVVIAANATANRDLEQYTERLGTVRV